MSEDDARSWLYRVLKVPDVLTTDEAKEECAAGAVRRIGGLEGAELGVNGDSIAEGLSKSVIDQLVKALVSGKLDAHLGGYAREHDKAMYTIASDSVDSARVQGVQALKAVEEAVKAVVRTMVEYAQEHPVTWPKLDA